MQRFSLVVGKNLPGAEDFFCTAAQAEAVGIYNGVMNMRDIVEAIRLVESREQATVLAKLVSVSLGLGFPETWKMMAVLAAVMKGKTGSEQFFR